MMALVKSRRFGSTLTLTIPADMAQLWGITDGLLFECTIEDRYIHYRLISKGEIIGKSTSAFAQDAQKKVGEGET